MASWNYSNRYRKFDGSGLDDHIFCDFGCVKNGTIIREGGDDGNDGTIDTPYKTPSFAVSQAVSGKTIVFAPADMENQLGDSVSFVDLSIGIRIVGDSKNGDVIFRDTVGDKLLFKMNGSINAEIKDITIIGYKTPIEQTALQCIINGVRFVDSTDGFVNITGLSMTDVTFINNDAISYNSTSIEGGRFENSNIINEIIQSNRYLDLYRCTLDKNCFHIAGSGAGQNRLDECYIYDLTTFDNGDPTRLVIESSVIDEQGNPSALSTSYQDKSVPTGDVLLKETGSNIGSVVRGISFSPESPSFVQTVLNNPDVEIDLNGNINLVDSVPVGESRDILGFGILSSGKNRLSVARQIGISVMCEYKFMVVVYASEEEYNALGHDINTTYSMGDYVFIQAGDVFYFYASNIDNNTGVFNANNWTTISQRRYKFYRLGELMTWNSDGTATGEDGYNWLNNEVVAYTGLRGGLRLLKV